MRQTKYTNCVRIERVDGEIIGMTQLDKDLTIGGQLYEASISHIPSAISTTANLAVNNAELGGYMSIAGLSRDDLVTGKFDYARIYAFLYDYENETTVRDLGTGWIGEVTLKGDSYTAEYRSLAQKMQVTIGRTYTAECDAKLGDSRCGIDINDYTETGTITSVTSNSVFTDSGRGEADDYFNYGNITFTSGNNEDLSMEIKDFGSGQFSTFLPLPHAVQVGDTYSVHAGCDKIKSTCKNKFDNVPNFRGFDTIPGIDQINKFGGQ